mmetsp:Transcript_50922/g.110656  ORF Transcript_50922/g.110656 Transcript_50922/m.110656 type:complete len:213 (-) Transcript_50922:14-652(-)
MDVLGGSFVDPQAPEQADPLAVIEKFMTSSADLFFLFYSGCSAEGTGAWCFGDGLVGLWDILQTWQTSREIVGDNNARLIIICDAPLSGKWADALRQTPPEMVPQIADVAVQASCHPDESCAEDENGGLFLQQWTRDEEIHGASAKSIAPTQRLPLPETNQRPMMIAKWDPVSHRRTVLHVGPVEHSPRVSLFGAALYNQAAPEQGETVQLA